MRATVKLDEKQIFFSVATCVAFFYHTEQSQERANRTRIEKKLKSVKLFQKTGLNHALNFSIRFYAGLS